MVERVGIETFVDPRKAVAGARQTNRALGSMEKSALRTDRKFKELNATSGLLKRGLVGIAASLSVRQVAQYSDAWTEVNNKLRQVTDSHQELKGATQDVFDIAVSTRSNFEATAALYARTAREADKLGISQQQVAQFTKAFNQALQSSGATATESASAILQASQAIQANNLAGDELRALRESAPALLQAIADEAGVTTGELKEMGAQGKISADLIVKGILNASDKFDSDFSKSVATASANMETARTITTKWVGENKTLSGSVQTLSKGAITLAENLDTVTTAATAAAAVIAARKFGPIVAQNAIAIRANTASMLANAAATSKASIQTNAYGQVVSRTTAITKTATIANRAASGAMALVGGPVGAATLAAFAVYELSQAFDDTEDKARAATEEVDGYVTKLQSLNEVQRGLQLTNLIADQNDNLRKQAALSEKINAIRGGKGERTQKKRLQDELDLLKARGEILSKQQQATFDSRLPDFPKDAVASTVTSGAGSLSDEAQRFQNKVGAAILGLKRELAEVSGDGSTLATIRFEIDQGSLKGVSEQSARTLKDLAGQIDARESLAESAEREVQAMEQAAANLAALEQELLTPAERVNQTYQNRIEIIRNAGLEEARTLELTAKVAAQKAEQLKALQEEQVVGLDAIFGKGSMERLFSDFNEIEENFKGLVLRMAVEATQAQILQGFGMSSGGMKSFTDIGGIIGGFFGPGKANGGRFGPGEAFPINERGPEMLNLGNKQFLMTNGSKGSITPNEQITQSTTKIVNVTMPVIAPDPQTFRKSQRQLVVESKRRLGG